MIQGVVIYGDGVGKKIGFPTANIDCKKEDIDICSGVYAVWVMLYDKKYPGALAIRDNPWKVEVHLIGFGDEKLYEKELKIEIVKKVSEMRKYEGRDLLIKKIEDDIKKVKKVFEL